MQLAGCLRIAVFLPLLALLSACPGKPPATPGRPKPAAQTAGPETLAWRVSKSGLGFRLSNADPEPAPRPKLARTTALDEKTTTALLKRLPAMKRAAQGKPFNLRDRSPPAPRPGDTLKTPFPPAASAPPPPPTHSAGASLVRFAPEGDVELAPNLSLTFSEPMVAVTSLSELEARADRPARLTPEPPGRWRWVGTQTLLFEPNDERFPKATDYTVEVPATARSASGRPVAKATRFSFRLPAPRVEHFHPASFRPIELEPLLFARFDQKIEEQAVLSAVEIKPKGRLPSPPGIALRLASAEEIEADSEIRQLAQSSDAGRFVVFRALGPLPKASELEVVFKRGLPSAEGPKRTGADQRFGVRTYGSMRLNHVDCGWAQGCPPLAEWRLRFSNPIDASRFHKSLVRVVPELASMRVDVSRDFITIGGRSKGRTRYKLSLGELRDTFGQPLEAPREASVDVTAAEPMLFEEERPMVVLDPAFAPELSVYSVNRKSLRVRLYAVSPGDFPAYLKYLDAFTDHGRITQPPGRLIATRNVEPKKAPDELVETRIDLAPALKDGVGQVIAVVEPPVQKPKKRNFNGEREWVRSWVQVTGLGLQAFSDPTTFYGWVSRLADGAPVADAEVGVYPEAALARSGADGIARLPARKKGVLAFARKGSDVVLLPGDPSLYDAGVAGVFAARPSNDHILWFVFDDRNLYKPGERVNVKGYVRLGSAGRNGDVTRLKGPQRVRFSAKDQRDDRLTEGQTDVDPEGGFQLGFDLPKNANLGSATLKLALEGSAARFSEKEYEHGFEIEEFRRPEFEVSVETSAGPHFVGQHAIATVSGSYYSGGALPDSEVEWRVVGHDVHFTPPNRRGFHFGRPANFWFFERDTNRLGEETFKARTHAGGKHRLRVDFDALVPGYPRQLDLFGSVSDVNRQTWTEHANLLVHPASVTVGLRPENTLPTAGQNLQVDVLVTDIEGRAVAGRPINVTCARIESSFRGDQREEHVRDPTTSTLTSDGVETGQRCAFATKAGGRHRLTAEVVDAQGRKSHTQLELWVLGGSAPVDTGVREDQVELIPDKAEYKGGDEARLLVIAPFAPAEGVLTLAREGVVELRRFRLARRAETLSVRLDRSWVPGVTAAVHLVGATLRANDNGDPDPKLPKRPAFATGDEATLELPPSERALVIGITPGAKKLDPGSTTDITLDVKDAQGRPAPATLTLVVVDEAVLTLAGYKLPDPLSIFYARSQRDVRAFDVREHVVLGKPDLSRMQLRPQTPERKPTAPAPSASAVKTMVQIDSANLSILPPLKREKPKVDEDLDGREGPEKPRPFKVRADFSALAAFLPRISTDARGHAVAKVKLSDSLTRYRVIAVAAAGENQFGSAESDLTTRLPLMVRPSAPRFLNYGDKAELPVVIQNQTAEPLLVDVGLRAANLATLAAHGQRVAVPAADRVELRFPIAAQEPGTARLQVGASGVGRRAQRHSDAAELELPVYSPATSEAFATHGAIDQGAVAQPVQMPRGVVKNFGGLEITTSSTALQGLTDAVLYLVRYPFECNEQLASRVLAIAALSDVLRAFEAEGLPKPELLEHTLALDVERLVDLQIESGGWDYWRSDRNADPYLSVHVANALIRAKAKAHRVPEKTLSEARKFLRNIRQHFAAHWPLEARRVVEAYALDVRRRAGDADAPRARALLREAGGPQGLSNEALGWLLPLFSKDRASAAELASVRRLLQSRVSETAGKAHFVTDYGDSGHLLLHSDRRADGILLDALIEDRPESDLVPKLVSGLLADRKRGRWLNTQENVFILLALDRYFQAFEKATPDFVARSWVGDRFAGEHRFRGRSVDRRHVEIPMSALMELSTPSNLVLAKEGQGRLYYRVGMKYAPADLRPLPVEHGFSVKRVYEPVESTADVQRGPDGSWRVRAGALVRTRLTLVAPARRYHVALVDPLPAGFEPLNPALAATPVIPRDPNDEPDPAERLPGSTGGKRSRAPWWWSRAWYEHQNLRDERVEAFASLLWEGVYSYAYVARATTPGEFVVPPPKAEEMYDPETFGRGASDRVVIR